MVNLNGTQPGGPEPVTTSHAGGTSSPVRWTGEMTVQTWLCEPLQVAAEAVLPARWEDVEGLLRSQCNRLDGVFRRLA